MNFYQKVFAPKPSELDTTQIHEGLWMGSRPPTGSAVGDDGFDLLVLCAEEYQPPSTEFPGVKVIHAPFDDNKVGPTAQEKKIASHAATRVAHALREGAKVLVTCYAGRNRSGLVTGLALVENGHDPLRAYMLITDKRDYALTNKFFVDLIVGR